MDLAGAGSVEDLDKVYYGGWPCFLWRGGGRTLVRFGDDDASILTASLTPLWLGLGYALLDFHFLSIAFVFAFKVCCMLGTCRYVLACDSVRSS